MKVFSNALKPALSSALQPLVLGSGVISYVKKTLEQEIKSIFSKYATAPKAWYDPSDLSTQFQDSAGTAPVTAVGQPVGLTLDKGLGLVRGPELTTNGSFDAGESGWSVRGADATHIVTFSGGALRFQSDTTTPQLTVWQTIGAQPGRIYEVTVVCSAWVSGSVKIFESALGQLVVSGVGTFRARMQTPGVSFAITRNSGDVDLTLDSVSLREIPGNHRIQPTPTSRKTLQARTNLFTATEFPNGLSDTFSNGGGVTADTMTGYAGALRFPAGTNAWAYKGQTLAIGDVVNISVIVQMDDGMTPVFGSTTTTSPLNTFVLIVGGVVPTITNTTVTPLGGAFYRVSQTHTFTTAPSAATAGVVKYLQNDARTFKVTAFQLTRESALSTYQRVTSNTDYADIGAPRYWQYDGVDDGDYTAASVDFSASDEVTVTSGLVYQSEASGQVVVEFSASYSANAGTFTLWAPPGAGAGVAFFASKGTVNANTTRPLAVGQAAVVTGQGKVSADYSALRIGGVQHPSSTTDQGTGNYGNYALYFGNRNNTSTGAWHGREYGTLIIGKKLEGADLAAVERWAAGKAGVKLP